MHAEWVARLESSQLTVPEPSGTQTAERGHACLVFAGILDNGTDIARRLGLESLPRAREADLLLDAYLEAEAALLPMLRGAFALLLLDRRRNIGFCLRDPLGTYPLFTADDADAVLVSPSIDALLAQRGVSRRVNVAALADQLLERWPDPRETFFESIRRVPAGHTLRIQGKEQHLSRYWEPAPLDGPVRWLEPDEITSFDMLFEQAVLRCLDRGRAGIFLSGGLDSVSVAAIASAAARNLGVPAPWALSLAFPDPDVNEEEVQKLVAAGLGLRQVLLGWREAVGPRGLVAEALDLTMRAPAPIINFWMPAYDRLAHEGTSRGCATILTGAGGDEWLGVSPFYAADLLRRFDVFGLYRLLAAQRRSYHLPPVAFYRASLWRFGIRPLIVERIARGAPALLRARKSHWARTSIPPWIAPAPELRSRIVERGLEANRHSAQLRRPPTGSHPRFYFEQLRRSLDHPLVAMELEETFEQGRRLGAVVRMPYWDADLLSLLYRMPPDQLNRGGRAKGLVREALARRFPDLGFERQRKVTAMRFGTALLGSEAAAAWESIGGAQALAEAGVIDANLAKRAVDALLTERTEPRKMQGLWNILNLESWLRPRL